MTRESACEITRVFVTGDERERERKKEKIRGKEASSETRVLRERPHDLNSPGGG